jgi:hypothetical protein
MGRQWSAGKLVLILDAVHWNPEAPPRTRLRLASEILVLRIVPSYTYITRDARLFLPVVPSTTPFERYLPTGPTKVY